MIDFNIKKRIEEKSIVLEGLIQQCDKEKSKLFLFKNDKKISELEKQITALDKEIQELEIKYNAQLELKKSTGTSMSNFAIFAKKHGLKTCIGCAAAFMTYCGYLYFKPMNINGNQITYRSMIESYEDKVINSADYTPETYERYMNDLEDAEARKNDIFMSDEEKLAYVDALLSAYNGLEPIPDKTALLSALNEANKYDISAYTPVSAEVFKSVISEMREIYNDSNATRKEVAEAETSIAAAYRKLILKADKTGLVELYNKYSGFALDDYTPSSVKSFNKEIESTKKLIDDENASQNNVDKQIQTMQSVETLLVKKADTTSLQSLIDECNSLDGSKYKEGYSDLVSEVKLVTPILANADVTQEEVDSVVSRLQTAKSNMVEYVINLYRINMRAVMQSNNHVGNDWSYARYYNGESVHDGFQVSGEPGSSVSVEMEITERDKSPDSNSGTATITLENGYQTSFDITVRENRGRYSGNTATFTVYVTVTYLGRE